MKVKLERLNKNTYPYLDDSDIDKEIPIAYGKISVMELTPTGPDYQPTNKDALSEYKLPIGTSYVDPTKVYVENNETMISATGVYIDKYRNTVVVKNGRDASGATRKCKVVDLVGYTFDGHSYPLDVIKHIFKSLGNIDYNQSNFNTTQFESELNNAKVKADIGFLITKDCDLWKDIIFPISCNSKDRYRVWIDKGKITAKVKDFDRASSGLIASADIVNIDELPISTDKSKIYSSVIVKYAHNYYSDTWLSCREDAYEKDVKSKYRIIEENELETYIVNESDAKYRAYQEAIRTSYLQKVIELEVFNNENLSLFDIVTIAAMPDNLVANSREYAGNNDCMILSVKPNRDKQTNKISAVIIPNRVPLESQAAVLSSAYTTISREKSTIDLVNDTAEKATVTFTTLALAQVSGKPGDLFQDGGIMYRANAEKELITVANSNRLTTIRFPDVADITALNALTGMINYDSVYQLDTLQWYYYLNGWQTDGAPPLNGQYTNTIFAVNSSPTAYPALSQVDAPPGWYDAPPVVGDSEYLWMSKSTWRDTTRLSNWSTPVRISGTLTTLTTQYSIDGINWTTSTTGAIYMRTSPDGGTTWSDAIRIKGEQGAQGPSGSGLYVQISDPTETSASYQDGQLGTFAGYNYIWTATSPSTGYWTIQERNPISSDSLYAYYSFDENGTTVFGDYLCIDNSGKTHNGYAKNASIVTGFRGNALSITARNQYINI